MDGSSTGRCYKTMLIKSYINYSLQFLMVFFFRCCFFCCREFWMEYFFVDFFNALCIYIYTHHFFWVAAIHSRRSWDTGGDVFSMYCHSKNDLSKRCSMFGIQQHPPSQPAFSSYSSVPPKNMSFSCIYIYISLTWGFTTRRWKDANAATDHHSARGRCWSVEGSQGL